MTLRLPAPSAFARVLSGASSPPGSVPAGRDLAGRLHAGRALPIAAALLAGAAVLAGCGTGRTVHLTGDELRVTLSEYRIEPQAVSVPAGRVRIVAHNAGILTHNVQLERGSLDSDERPVLAVIHTLLPGASASVTTGPLRPGAYLLVSGVDDQTTLGMATTLRVR